jgi:hypothetical protein
MRRWGLRFAAAAAVLFGLVLLHQGLVVGARVEGALGRAAGGSCAACH